MRIQNNFIVMRRALWGKKPQLLNLNFGARLNQVLGVGLPEL